MIDLPPTGPVLSAPAPPVSAGGDQALRQAAEALEASFLGEMLKAAGLDAAAGGLGSGPGQGEFGSFLREAQARDMVAAGGIGLAQQIFETLKARADAG